MSIVETIKTEVEKLNEEKQKVILYLAKEFGKITPKPKELAPERRPGYAEQFINATPSLQQKFGEQWFTVLDVDKAMGEPREDSNQGRSHFHGGLVKALRMGILEKHFETKDRYDQYRFVPGKQLSLALKSGE